MSSVHVTIVDSCDWNVDRCCGGRNDYLCVDRGFRDIRTGQRDDQRKTDGTIWPRNCQNCRSFARIFFRNAINVGLPVLVCPEASEGLAEGDSIQVDLTAGTITRADGETYQATPLPDFIAQIVNAGGLVPFLRTGELVGEE